MPAPECLVRPCPWLLAHTRLLLLCRQVRIYLFFYSFILKGCGEQIANHSSVCWLAMGCRFRKTQREFCSIEEQRSSKAKTLFKLSKMHE